MSGKQEGAKWSPRCSFAGAYGIVTEMKTLIRRYCY